MIGAQTLGFSTTCKGHYDVMVADRSAALQSSSSSSSSAASSLTAELTKLKNEQHNEALKKARDAAKEATAKRRKSRQVSFKDPEPAEPRDEANAGEGRAQ